VINVYDKHDEIDDHTEQNKGDYNMIEQYYIGGLRFECCYKDD